MDVLGWENENKTTDESNNTTRSDESKYIDERRETQKIPR